MLQIDGHGPWTSQYLLATVATPIDSAFSAHAQTIMQVKIINRFTHAAAALVQVCPCRMQMQHAGYVLYKVFRVKNDNRKADYKAISKQFFELCFNRVVSDLEFDELKGYKNRNIPERMI